MFRPVRRKTGPQTGTASADIRGAIAQLGERYNGIVEVVGSIPSGSTIFQMFFKGLERLLLALLFLSCGERDENRLKSVG